MNIESTYIYVSQKFTVGCLHSIIFIYLFYYARRYMYIACSLGGLKKVYVLVSLLMCQFGALAQDFMLHETSDFHYYYTAETAPLVHQLDSSFVEQLLRLQKKLNYFANSPIDVFLLPANQAYEFRNRSTKSVKSGEVKLASHKVVLNINKSYSDIVRYFSHAVSTILVDEMMFGSTFQDKIKSSNLINLPPWVLDGLYHYLAYGWDVQTDNSMRFIYDEYGFQDFNAIPERYDAIKGASFWKFLVSKYGVNAIPEVLYAARLTRKFNASIYYSFQTSIYNVYLDWKVYYTAAYESDQNIPNPVQGFILDKAKVLDFYVINPKTYYILQESFSGLALFRVNAETNQKTRIYRLEKKEYINDPFGGYLAEEKGEIYLLVHTHTGSQLITIENNKVDRQMLNGVHARNLAVSGGKMYVSESRCDYSSVWELSPAGIKQVISDSSWIGGFDIRKGRICWSSTQRGHSSLFMSDLASAETKELATFSEQCSQPIFADDDHILFNASLNGVVNGKMISAKTKKITSLTNYRSNILYHQYSGSVFVEYLDRAEMSALFIAEHIPVPDFFVYDTLYPTYFFSEPNSQEVKTTDSAEQNTETEAPYSFQSPVHPDRDFTSSDYDSLQKSGWPSLKKLSTKKAVNVFEPFAAQVALVNQPVFGSLSAYQGNVGLVLPSSLNLNIGAQMANQYGDDILGISYTGLLQLGARDLYLSYKKLKKYNLVIDLLHRRRVLYAEDSRIGYTSNVAYLSHCYSISKYARLINRLGARYDNETPLLVSQEGISTSSQSKSVMQYSSSLGYNRALGKKSLQAEFLVQPALGVGANQGVNITIEVKARYIYSVNTNVKFTSTIDGGTSQGSSPIYYSLGGSAFDFNADLSTREYSDFKTPMLYSNKYGVRGFQVNYRNGNTFFNNSNSISYKIVESIMNRPVASEFFSNLYLGGFIDMGTSMYGNSIYDKANVLNRRTIFSSTRALEIEIQALKNPFIISTGLELGTRIYNYPIKLSYAYGYEDQKFKKPLIHLDLGIPLF